MKKLLIVGLLGLTAALPGYAATATGNFDVTINLTGVCQITTSPAPLTLDYTSLGAAVSATTSYAVTCTSGASYTMALDSAGGTGANTGLAYTLALTDASGTGDGTAKSHTITGSIAAGQGGTVGPGNTSTDTINHTLTITY